MEDKMNEITTISVRRRTASRFGIIQKKLGFHSADELISSLINLLIRKEWTKTDMESLERYGRIIREMSGSAKTEDEMYQKTGIKGDIVLKLDETSKIKGEVKKPETKKFDFRSEERKKYAKLKKKPKKEKWRF